MKRLENEYIVLKDLEYKYLDDMFEYACDERVAENAGFKVHENLRDTQDMMNMLIETNEVWGIYDQSNDKLIGSLGIHFRSKHPIHKEVVYGIGFDLNPKYWRKGIMSMACDLALEHFFFEMDGQVIYANHFDYNNRSEGFINKYGMVFEGNWFSKKRNHDNSIYKMTKERFLEKRIPISSL